MTRQHQRIRSLSSQRKRQTQLQDAKYLRQACGEDRALQSRVEELIENHLRAGSFLDLHDLSAPDTDSMSDFPNSSIGPYKLVRKLGEGGMGVVFLAEQSEPFERQVAVKVIRAGMNSEQVVARFEQERQALAVMDHVNIARVIDGG